MGELKALSALMQRSKAHWGYSEAFMTSCRPELTLTPQSLEEKQVFVLERISDGRPVGLFALEAADADTPDRGELSLFFVEPEWIGRGAGRRMMEEAVRQAKAAGFRRLVVQSDPYAEPFYRAMGFSPVGEQVSESIPGRRLPVLEREMKVRA